MPLPLTPPTLNYGEVVNENEIRELINNKAPLAMITTDGSKIDLSTYAVAGDWLRLVFKAEQYLYEYETNKGWETTPIEQPSGGSGSALPSIPEESEGALLGVKNGQWAPINAVYPYYTDEILLFKLADPTQFSGTLGDWPDPLPCDADAEIVIEMTIGNELFEQYTTVNAFMASGYNVHSGHFYFDINVDEDKIEEKYTIEYAISAEMGYEEWQPPMLNALKISVPSSLKSISPKCINKTTVVFTLGEDNGNGATVNSTHTPQAIYNMIMENGPDSVIAILDASEDESTWYRLLTPTEWSSFEEKSGDRAYDVGFAQLSPNFSGLDAIAIIGHSGKVSGQIGPSYRHTWTLYEYPNIYTV